VKIGWAGIGNRHLDLKPWEKKAGTHPGQAGMGHRTDGKKMIMSKVMDSKFIAHIEALKPQLRRLLSMAPVTPQSLPPKMPRRGIYLLSEGERHLYVGRSNDIRKRIRGHSGTGATHLTAAFAFRLAREATGKLKASYKKGEGSRAKLMEDPRFVDAFSSAKNRIRNMNLRFIEEADPVRQTLLEIYVAVVLKTPYNDFENH